jgi:hypothetical protein
MKRFIPGIALLVGALAISGQASAHGGGWYGPVIGAAVVGAVVGAAVSGGHDRTVYVERQPAYYRHRCMCNRHPPCTTSPTWSNSMCRHRRHRCRRYYGPPPVYYGPPRW